MKNMTWIGILLILILDKLRNKNYYWNRYMPEYDGKY